LEITNEIEAYLQTLGLRKTLECISLDRRRCIEEDGIEEEIEESIGKMCSNGALIMGV
jgi:hypothetical protein